MKKIVKKKSSGLNPDEIIMVATVNVSGLIYGKGFPSANWEERDERKTSGVGWTFTNLMINAFNGIAPSPWGSFGDLYLKPDPDSLVSLHLESGRPGFNFVLSDVCHPDGTPWNCCPRTYLKKALAELKAKTGLELVASFEHEFSCLPDQPLAGLEGHLGNSGFRLEEAYAGEVFMSKALQGFRQAGVDLETFFPEYGPAQFEFTLYPRAALAAADEAVKAKEILRYVAHSLGKRASFTPLLRPDLVGNGVHVHFSLIDQKKKPVNYDPAQSDNLSDPAAQFIAGILQYGSGLTAITAPTYPSYFRLQPHRWSAGYNNLGVQDREAMVRICPVFGKNPEKKFHFEYRASDGAANPYLVLGSLVHAGLAGLENKLPRVVSTQEDISTWSKEQLREKNIRKLPDSLSAALDELERESFFQKAMGADLFKGYLANKRSENEFVEQAAEEYLAGLQENETLSPEESQALKDKFICGLYFKTF